MAEASENSRLGPERTEAANDLLTVTVSFIMYVSLILVLTHVQAEALLAPPEPPRTWWTLQELAALVMAIGGCSHLLGAAILVRQRVFRLLLASAELLAALSLHTMQPRSWVWMALAALACAGWALCFQAAIMFFMALTGDDEPVEAPEDLGSEAESIFSVGGGRHEPLPDREPLVPPSEEAEPDGPPSLHNL
ncbi:MAG TPA: hypothetical protein VGM19_14080 [Armatimonadota bacterium]|jgi:hypothetical protein